MNRVKDDFSSLVPGNTVDSVIKRGRARGRTDFRNNNNNNKFVSDMLSLILILVLPGQSPSLNSVNYNSIPFQNWIKIFLLFGREKTYKFFPKYTFP